MTVFAYQYDIAGIVSIIACVACLIMRPKYLRRTGLSLRYLLCLSVISNLLDLITSVLLNDPKYSSYYTLTNSLLIVYFITMFLLPAAVTAFFVCRCGVNVHLHRALIIPACMTIPLLLFNDEYHFYYNLTRDPMAYSIGPGVVLVFAYWIFCVGVILYNVLRHSRYLGKLRQHFLLSLLAITVFMILPLCATPSLGIAGMALGYAISLSVTVFAFVDVTMDPMTGCRNMVGFTRAVDELLHNTEDEDYRLYKIDIYHLQTINERFGHEVGDEFIIETGRRLDELVAGKKAACGRIGGDLFALCIRDRDMRDIPMTVNLEDFIHLPYHVPYFDVSFYAGTYLIHDRSMPLDLMMDRAEYALKTVTGSFTEHKANFDGSMRTRFHHERYIEQKIQSSLDTDEFKIYLQPVYDAQTQEIAGAEALTRWVDEKFGIIMPGEFIPAFEKNGFISTLDMLVLRKVCRTLRKMIDHDVQVVPVSVNISRVDISNPHLAEDITEVVDEYGLDHSLIRLEITESAFTDQEPQLKITMDRLHDQHFLILMDDFGSGYSNFNMFRNMPVDVVKLDMAFVRGIEDSKNGQIIVRSIMEMTKELGLSMVVEGVENQKQYEFFRNLGCELIQGYYFSKPMSAEDFRTKQEELRVG